MTTKLRLVFSIAMVFLSFYSYAQRSYWEKDAVAPQTLGTSLKHVKKEKANFFKLDEEVFKAQLQAGSRSGKIGNVVYFPDKDGVLVPFTVEERNVLAPALAKKYPDIKSYIGFTGDKRMQVRFSVSSKGMQSIIFDDRSAKTFVLQKVKDMPNEYILFDRQEETAAKTDFVCKTESTQSSKQGGASALKLVDDQTLRRYRIAVSASGEYTQHHGGTVAGALAAINATLTTVNAVYERDLGVTLQLVANNDEVIFTDPDTDPYNGSLNSEVQSTLTSIIGEANYDVGHLFHKDENNGNAGYIGAVCVNNKKGSGFSSGSSPEGDLYDLDFVAHELGHQFGANHTWSFESEGTLVQAEPASGTTIMGYAGIVLGNNVASHGDDYFHYYSILQISNYLVTTSCAEEVVLSNNPPVITTPLEDYIIPKSTPFVLAGAATDADVDDVLTYAWEQIDDGVVTTSTFGPTNPSGANFRSLPPTTDSLRYFPKLSSVIAGNLTQTSPATGSDWETVASIERTMNFAMTVRDNRAGGGQVVSDEMEVSVINSAGPFVITSHTGSDSFVAGESTEVTWDVANTHIAPIDAQRVDIYLSTDGGLTFPLLVADDVPNDGSQEVLLPGIPTTEARLMVKASANIFFAVNTANFTISASPIVLQFDALEYEVCQSDDLDVVFTYEAYDGFNEEVTFSIVDAPPGLSTSFSPATTIGTAEVTLSCTNTAGVSKGVYPVIVRATSATETKEVSLQLRILNSTFDEVVLTSPENGLVDSPLSLILNWEADTYATSYDVEIATDVAFTNVVQSDNVIINSFTIGKLSPETDYYWRVKPKNLCGEGVFSTAYSFTTTPVNCLSRSEDNLPIAISAVGTPTITSTMTILEDLPVSDVNVTLGIDHSYLADLVISLTSPAGTTVVLVSSSCGDGEDISATFDDDASPFTCGSNTVVDGVMQPSISGDVKPLGSLSSFAGESAFGEWVLEIKDTAPSDGGSLNNFTLDICVEGVLRPDEDNDGVYDDGDDLCLGTPKGAEVDTNGCPIYRFTSDNFSVAGQSESCRSSNDGAIVIGAEDTSVAYTVNLSGNGVNVSDDFTEEYVADNLTAGVYSVCIEGTDGVIIYEPYCVELVITEPEEIEVLAEAFGENNEQLSLQLEGASYFYIELNGVRTEAAEGVTTLALNKGANTLKVYTDLPCQGVVEKQFYVFDEPLVYPNPFVSDVSVLVGGQVTKAVVTVFNASGRQVYRNSYTVSNSEVQLALAEQPIGVYYIEVATDLYTRVFKVIKK